MEERRPEPEEQMKVMRRSFPVHSLMCVLGWKFMGLRDSLSSKLLVFLLHIQLTWCYEWYL